MAARRTASDEVMSRCFKEFSYSSDGQGALRPHRPLRLRPGVAFCLGFSLVLACAVLAGSDAVVTATDTDAAAPSHGSLAAELRSLSVNAVAHCDLLFSLPGMFSFNLWTGLPSPTAANVTHWFNLLSPAQQAAVIAKLFAHFKVGTKKDEQTRTDEKKLHALRHPKAGKKAAKKPVAKKKAAKKK